MAIARVPPIHVRPACRTLRSMIAAACAAWLFGACSTTAAPLSGCNEPLPELFERASPSVVMVTGQSINPYRLQDRVSRVLGSGFIIDAKGLILTNSHVVFGLQSLVVTLDDGTIAPARVVGADPIFDIAVIEIAKPKQGTLPVARLGNSDRLRPGDDVVAIGNPGSNHHSRHRERDQSHSSGDAAVAVRTADSDRHADQSGQLRRAAAESMR
jgi:S1-C subfamily serine protease